MSGLLLEAHRNFSFQDFMVADHAPVVSAHPDESTGLPLFPLFTPASVVAKHQSGPCQLWWPLDGTDIVAMYSTGEVGSVKGVMLFACNFTAEPMHELITVRSVIGNIVDGSVTLDYSFVKQYDGLNSPFDNGYQLNIPNNNARKFYFKILISSNMSDSVISEFNVAAQIITPSFIQNSDPISFHPMFSQLFHRRELGSFMNSLDLLGTYVEIGVNRGIFAEEVMNSWRGRRYIAVDPWDTDDVVDYIDDVNSPDKDRDKDMNEALRRLEPYADRVSVMRMLSTEAAHQFVDGTVDAVYIDAMHHYHAVMSDMQLWWGKIRSGGLMLGHDYVLGRYNRAILTVRPAVLEFARKVRVPVFCTLDHSWYMQKP
jgi:hypothetical protein